MSPISKHTRDELNNLSEKQLDQLADIMDIGMNVHIGDPPLDKDDKVLILATEPESELLKALKKLKAQTN